MEIIYYMAFAAYIAFAVVFVICLILSLIAKRIERRAAMQRKAELEDMKRQAIAQNRNDLFRLIGGHYGK